MVVDITSRVKEVREYYDSVLTERIKKISEISGVDESQIIKINPADFIEKNQFQLIQGYEYKNIRDWIIENKKDDFTFLVSPADKIEETASQISYKSNVKVERTIRASKCEILPLPIDAGQDFFIRNHRQTAPQIRHDAICFGLVFKGEVVAVMLYDRSNGAVRGKNSNFELVRLAIAKNAKVHGGASKLQKACEEALVKEGVKEIYSYSNATINSGAVYRALGFLEKKIEGGNRL